jgi:hypothetical protein
MRGCLDGTGVRRGQPQPVPDAGPGAASEEGRTALMASSAGQAAWQLLVIEQRDFRMPSSEAELLRTSHTDGGPSQAGGLPTARIREATV